MKKSRYFLSSWDESRCDSSFTFLVKIDWGNVRRSTVLPSLLRLARRLEYLSSFRILYDVLWFWSSTSFFAFFVLRESDHHEVMNTLDPNNLCLSLPINVFASRLPFWRRPTSWTRPRRRGRNVARQAQIIPISGSTNEQIIALTWMSAITHQQMCGI